MENEDNMMEENQNIIQPEEVEENPVAEVVTEDEPAAAEVEPSQPDTTEEEPVPEWRRKLTECWNKTVEFVKSHKRLVIYVLCAIVVLLAVLFVVERNKNSRNFNNSSKGSKTLASTYLSLKPWRRCPNMLNS